MQAATRRVVVAARWPERRRRTRGSSTGGESEQESMLEAVDATMIELVKTRYWPLSLQQTDIESSLGALAPPLS